VLQSDSSGALSVATPEYDTVGTAESVALGDVEGDGTVDVVVGELGTASGPSGLVALAPY
jgi:hypothetical protein